MGLGSSVFVSKLRDDTAAQPKRWLYLLYDQLNLELNPWKEEARGSVVEPVPGAVIQTDSNDTSPNIAVQHCVASSSHEHCDRLAEEHPEGA